MRRKKRSELQHDPICLYIYGQAEGRKEGRKRRRGREDKGDDNRREGRGLRGRSDDGGSDNESGRVKKRMTR